MSNDLISRETLKQEILPLLSLEERIVIENKIDNIQAVEESEIWEGGFADGLGVEARWVKPQGVWEDYSVSFYRCPECGYLLNKDCPCCHNKVILPKGGKE